MAETRTKYAALGFRVHSGWTALVAVSLDGQSPRVLWRQRPHLVETFTYEFRQPYHTAEKRPPAEAHTFISQMRTEAGRLACQSIESVQTDLRKQGYELKDCGLLLASGRPLPDLPHILASHALIHTADGELFRQALLQASQRCGFAVLTVRESELLERASRTLDHPRDQLLRCLADLGSSFPPPWAQDEKFAALVAWLSLMQRMQDN